MNKRKKIDRMALALAAFYAGVTAASVMLGTALGAAANAMCMMGFLVIAIYDPKP